MTQEDSGLSAKIIGRAESVLRRDRENHVSDVLKPLVRHALDQMIPKILYLLARQLLHDLPKLDLEDGDGMIGPLLAQRADTIHEGPPQKRKLRSGSKRPCYVGTGP